MISDVSRDDKDNLQALAPGLDVQSLRRRLKSHKKALNAIEQYRKHKSRALGHRDFGTTKTYTTW
jgi:predicted outer membrane protein